MTNTSKFPGALIPLQYHAVMLADETRVSAWKKAIELIVKPGMKVADLGSGTGILSFFAANAGADVYAVEKDPALADASRLALEENGISNKVTLFEGDAVDFVPPEAIDVVLCEMLHVGFLREHQIQVTNAFIRNHENAFGQRQIQFLPDTTFQAVQLIQHDFSYSDFEFHSPVFEPPGFENSRSKELSEPVVWQIAQFGALIDEECRAQGAMVVTNAGKWNAIRLITKNVLAIDIEKEESVDWHMQYLVVPIPEPIEVEISQSVNLEFSYRAGDEIELLQESIIARQI